MTQEVITAGEPVGLQVTLDQPATCDSTVLVTFETDPPQTSGFSVRAGIQKGQTSVAIKDDTMHDLPGGRYHSTNGILAPCPGFANNKFFKVPALNLTVRAYTDPLSYPSAAELTLQPTDHQFFDTKIAELEGLDGLLLARIDGNAADVPSLRVTLTQTVRAADEALTISEQQYRVQILKSQTAPLPAFFADFHRQYADLLVDIRAPIPGASASLTSRPSLLYVQLKKRPPNPATTGSGNYPPAVTATRKAIVDNEAVYKYINATGRISFDAKFSSTPSGATVKYKKVIDDVYMDYSAPTDVPKVKLELAAWQFIFHMEGCTDQPRRIDPWNDTTPDISVEFGRCAKQH